MHIFDLYPLLLFEMTDQQEKKRPEGTKPKFVRDPNYQPKMLKVTGLNISLDDFKKEIANRVSIAQDDQKAFCMFTSSQYW